MSKPKARPVRIADILVLVAASAGGLAVFNLVVKSVLYGDFVLVGLYSVPAGGWRTGQVVVRGVQWIALALPFAASWTFTVPLLRYLGPRGRTRRARADAGLVACLGAIFGFAWATVALGLTLALDRVASDKLAADPKRWLFHYVVEELFAYVGLAVAAAWVGLALSGRWRHRVDWLDEFGRALGVFWIVAGMVWACRRYLGILDY